ncbi:hypothetical protein ACO0LL_14170 [Undibacterium sp. TC4M20W]|uniref:hypothetical protein n=1 Tax=unclassified Undibacterium TaxID=2630295 RepID=UPI003BF400D3
MKNCDIYLLDKIAGDSFYLNQLKIFQSDLVFDVNSTYVGYLHMNIRRLTGVAIVTHLRNNRVRSWNIPVKYRDQDLLSFEEVNALAQQYATPLGMNVTSRQRIGDIHYPMFLSYYLNNESNQSDSTGGSITVDRLDGHIWTAEEMEEYFYDYNNLI